MILVTGKKREDRGGKLGQVSPTGLAPSGSTFNPTIFTTASPKEQTQVAAPAKLLDKPRIVVALGGDPAAQISFPEDGGEVALPLVMATRPFYRSAGWLETRGKLGNALDQLSVSPLGGLQRFDANTLYGSVRKLWPNVLVNAAFDYSVPVFKVETLTDLDERGRQHTVQWVVAIRAEDPSKTGRQALIFVLRKPDQNIFESIWKTLKSIPGALVRSAQGLWETVKGAVCGPAKPYIDDLALLAAGGPAALGASKMAELSQATGKSESELTKAAADPKSATIKLLTEAVVARVCEGSIDPQAPATLPTEPESEVSYPVGSVAVFDPSTSQFRILAPV